MASRYAPTIEERKADLEGAHCLFRLTKPRSQYIIQYVESPEDDWFIHVIKIKKKTQEWISCVMIVQKDLCTWLDYDEGRGWVKEAVNI
jgi:hypothetical protein